MPDTGIAPAAAILDLTIPGGMGGRDTALQIREFDPYAPLFVASGYAEDPIPADSSHCGFKDSIKKPFIKAELGKMLMKHLS